MAMRTLLVVTIVSGATALNQQFSTFGADASRLATDAGVMASSLAADAGMKVSALAADAGTSLAPIPSRLTDAVLATPTEVPRRRVAHLPSPIVHRPIGTTTDTIPTGTIPLRLSQH
jgi:hypothetical protein